MSGEIRRRTAARGSNETGGTTSSSSTRRPIMADDDDDVLLHRDEMRLSARALLSASPVHSSTAWKLHVPAMYAVLPSFVSWLLSWMCRRAGGGWVPRWKRRRLIALGGYLYRFEDFEEEEEDGGGGGGGGGRGGGGGKMPKGVPVPVATASARIVSDRDIADHVRDDLPALEILPGGCSALFEVSSAGKTQYFAVETAEEAKIWVNSLRQMRQDAITRGMGHSDGVPYPRLWESFDASARRLGERKSRIKGRLESIERREMEMQTMGGYYS